MILFSIFGLASSLSAAAAGESASIWYLGATWARVALVTPMATAPVARRTWNLPRITFVFMLSLLVVVIG
jgi:hypothetical protein